MITLIAESKTMTDCRISVAADAFAAHVPADETVADSIMARIRSLDINDIVSASRLRAPMARRLLEMAYDFPDKTHGERAVEAFTGVVFKALGYDSLSESSKKYVHDNVGIISSLYGWLRSDDIIKPYRLDYGMRLAPDDEPFSRFWKENVTRHISDILAARQVSEIIDLLPAEAAKCIDWEVISRSATVWKVDFVSIEDGGSLRTPHANLLKKARGHLLRLMAETGVKSADQLKRLESPHLFPVDSKDRPRHICFAL